MFVNALRRRSLAKRGVAGGGWDAVDEAWRSPPTTTEQLLHMAKYDAHEPAEVGRLRCRLTRRLDDGLRRLLRRGRTPCRRRGVGVEEVGGARGRRVGRRSRSTLFRKTPGGSQQRRPSPHTGPVRGRLGDVRFDRGPGQDTDAESAKPSRLWRPPSPTAARRQPSLCVERPLLGPTRYRALGSGPGHCRRSRTGARESCRSGRNLHAIRPVGGRCTGQEQIVA